MESIENSAEERSRDHFVQEYYMNIRSSFNETRSARSSYGQYKLYYSERSCGFII